MERRVQAMWNGNSVKRLQDGGFEVFGEKEDRVFCVIPGTDASNKDNGTHLSLSGSVTKLHIFGGKFLLPTKAFFLLSEIKIQFEVRMLHHSS